MSEATTTSKERLRHIVDGLSEGDAANVLDYVITHRREFEAIAPGSAPTSEPVRPTSGSRLQRGRLATIATIPAWLFVGLFLSVYAAMAIVIIVVIVKG
jgi:hypothetical protein